jgi:hypothetical protein
LQDEGHYPALTPVARWLARDDAAAGRQERFHLPKG